MSAIEDRDPIAKPAEASRSQGASPFVRTAFGGAPVVQSLGFRLGVYYRLRRGGVVEVSGYTPPEPTIVVSEGHRRHVRKLYEGPTCRGTRLEASEAVLVSPTGRPGRDDGACVPSGVDPVWRTFARRIGFLPVRDRAAVIEYRDPAYQGEIAQVTDAVEKVRLLKIRLAENGYSGVTISMAVPRLPGTETNRIFRAGAYIIEVPDTFWSLDDVDRIEAYRALVPAPRGLQSLPERVPASALRRSERVPGLYWDRNPALSEEDVREWRRRVSESSRSD